MARRKKTDTLRLDALTLLKLGKVEAEVRAANAEYALARYQRDALLGELDPEGTLRKLIHTTQALEAGVRTARTAYMDLLATVKSDFAIDLTHYSYDTETGVVFEHGGSNGD